MILGFEDTVIPQLERAIERVTPGWSPVRAAFPLPTPTRRRALRSEDLPTFGMPTTIKWEPVKLLRVTLAALMCSSTFLISREARWSENMT